MIKQLNKRKQRKNKNPGTGSNPSRLKSKFVRFKESDDGVAAIEFAFVGPVFLALIFAIIDVAIYFMMERVTEAGTDTVSRKIKTQVISGSVDEAGLRAHICAVPSLAFFNCDDIKFDVKVISKFEPPVDAPRNADGSLNSTGFSVNIGVSQQIHVVRLYAPWPALLPWGNLFALYGGQVDAKVDGERMISASTAFLME